VQTHQYFAMAFLLFVIAIGVQAQAQTPASPATTSLSFTLKPLGHNIYAAIDDAKGDACANGGDGVAVM
jgi:hypothetical protein